MRHTVERVTLDNGAEGLLIDVPDAPVVTFDFNFRAGYFLSPDKKWDTPHVLEHLMFGANQRFKKARLFNQELEKNGAYANASTDNWYVSYVAECAAFEADRVLDLLLLSLTQPLLNEGELKAEIGNVHEELAGNLNRYFRVLSTRLAVESGIPTTMDEERLAQLSDITAEDVRSHYEKTHTQANMRFIIAGDISQQKGKIIERLQEELARLPKGERFEFINDTPQGVDKPVIIDRPDVEKLHYYIDIFSSQRRLDDQELVAVAVLNQLLTGSMSSRIYGAAREQGIAYGVASSLVNSHDYAQWWFGGTVNYSNAQKLFKLMAKEVKRVADGKITEKEVEAAKLQNLGMFMRGNQKLSDVMGVYASRYFYDGTIKEYEKIPEQIKQVSKQSLVDVANMFLTQQQWALGLLGRVEPKQADELYKLWNATLTETA